MSYSVDIYKARSIRVECLQPTPWAVVGMFCLAGQSADTGLPGEGVAGVRVGSPPHQVGKALLEDRVHPGAAETADIVILGVHASTLVR